MSSKLNQTEKIKCFEFLERYAHDIEHNYGRYNWGSPLIDNFCRTKNINKKTKNNIRNLHYYFWFESHKMPSPLGNLNDTAYHFLRHIRNAIAHGLIKKERRMIIVQDFQKSRNGRVTTQTMQGQLLASDFWNFVDAVESTKQ
ncbi:MAG: hypothetical protein IJS20_07530 [Bacteroidales bacterium]|nr:hypothetical protein [Bacteroidales bacterium]